MFNSSLIKNIVILVGAVFLSIWMGMSIVTEQTETLINIAAIAVCVISVLLGQRIWLLFILFEGMDAPLLRGFSTAQLGQVLFIGFSLVMFLMRRLRAHWHFNELDFWRLLLALSIVQVFVRHPTGLNIFGGDSVGGKPYFLTALAWVASFVLSKYRIPAKELKWGICLHAIGSLVTSPLTKLRGGGGSVQGIQTVGEGLNAGAGERTTFLFPYATFLAKLVPSFISPLRGVFHFFWGPLILFSIGLAAFTGFRNVIATVGMIYLVGIVYRGGFVQFLLASFLGIFGLAALALVNLNYPLPGKMQRALSPLPGTWEERYIDAGDRSTEWRMEMWKEALLSDKWIENKILGDGLGFTKEQLEQMAAAEAKGNRRAISGLNQQQESMMISGSYHSGPVQTIRTTGYVGLFILLAAMTRLAVHAHREIMRCKGTEWYPWVLFATIPILTTPFIFVFFFGEFTAGVTFVFFNSGLIQLLQNNLPLPAYRKISRR